MASPFIRHNTVFFVGSLAVGALNYLYYPVLGRLLSPSDFGEVQTLVSLFLQAAIFFTVVTNVTVNIVANESNDTLRSRIVYELEYVAVIITVAVLAVGLLLAPEIRGFLKFSGTGPFFVLALALLVSVPVALRNAYLRGHLAFGQLSAAGIIGALAKLIFSAGLVLLGLRTLGAIGGLVAAQLVALAYSTFQASRLGLRRVGQLRLWRPIDIALIRPHLPYAALVLVVSLITTTLFSFDIIVVKHYFPAAVAGQYAGIATVARIIYFLTASIAAVLLSSVKLTAGRRANRQLLLRSAALQTAIGAAVLVMFTVAPNLVIRVLIGFKYDQFANLLPKLGLALFILALVNLVLSYDLALRRRSAAVVAGLGAISMGTIVILHHASLAQVVDTLLWGSLVLLAVRGADSLRRIFRNTDHHA